MFSHLKYMDWRRNSFLFCQCPCTVYIYIITNFICRVNLPPTHLSRQRAPLGSQLPQLAAGHHLLVAIVYVGHGHIPVKVTGIHSTAVPAAVHKLTGVELPNSWGRHKSVVSVQHLQTLRYHCKHHNIKQTSQCQSIIMIYSTFLM